MLDVIIGTAGHIDHGKTTLVKALTGIDTDRLEEEKRRGITIDIGFAHMEMGGYRIGFVDVPGHEKFVKNMLAGIGGIDLALLVVAATESVMPQTIEHFDICSLLGIRLGLVALTKKNQADPELLELVQEEIRDLTRGTFLENTPIVPVDSVDGDGIEDLKRKIGEVLAGAVRERDPSGAVFRMPIDRVFTMRGFGTVVTGTPNAGTLGRDEPIAVYPSGETGKVRSIEIFNAPAETARAGQRAALNITGLEKQDLERGMVLSRPGVFEPSDTFDTTVRILPRAIRPLVHRAPVRFHHGSAEIVGRVYLLEGDEVAPGQSAIVQIRLDTPTVCCSGDRFILRSYSPITTIGGGIVLDSQPPRHSRKTLPESLPVLQKFAGLCGVGTDRSNFRSELLDYMVARSGLEGITLPALVGRTGRARDALLGDLGLMTTIQVVAQEQTVAVSRRALADALPRLGEVVERHHRENPLSPGIPREELKSRAVPAASSVIYQFLLATLVEAKKVRFNGGNLLPFEAELELNESQKQLGESIVERLERGGLQPPTIDELPTMLGYPLAEIKKVFHFLIARGDLVRITSDIVVSASQAHELKDQMGKAFGRGQEFSVAEFKDVFNVSRKYAIPILEFLDRERVTRRSGDKRVLLP